MTMGACVRDSPARMPDEPKVSATARAMYADVLHADLWALKSEWSDRFPERPGLRAELGLLGRLFPFDWRGTTFGAANWLAPARHPLPNELRTLPGRTRLLDLAAALLREGAGPLSPGPDAAWQIPMQGRLRYWNLYDATLSEFLVGPLLRPVGEVIWQPPGRGPRADYVVRHDEGVLVAEVKRLCLSERYEALTQRLRAERFARLAAGHVGPESSFWTEEERRLCAEGDVPRLYRRVTYAAKQLAASAARAAGGPGKGAPGVLFLDVHENAFLLNLMGTLCGWMTRDWARSIDLVVCFYYSSPLNGTSGTVARAAYSRSDEALEVLSLAHHPSLYCDHRHLHLAGVPPGGCAVPFGI